MPLYLRSTAAALFLYDSTHLIFVAETPTLQVEEERRSCSLECSLVP